MTISFLRASARQGYTTLGVSVDGETKKYTVPDRAVATLFRGYELDPLEYEEIVRLDEERRAQDKAASLLSASDKSRSTLRMRLSSLGFSRESAEGAVEECVRLGYLNEERQLRRLISREALVSLRGPKYIVRKLASKGYAISDIRRIISELTESGEIDFSDSFARLAEKRGATDPESLRALAYKYGYK